MDPRILNYYNQELIFTKDLAQEFAEAHPQVAANLGIGKTQIKDPYIERLIESFSFMSARIQVKMDAEFPKLSQKILEILHPDALAPVPSMALLALTPTTFGTNHTTGVGIEKGTLFRAEAGNATTACTFTAGHALTLWPLSVSSVRYQRGVLDTIGLPNLIKQKTLSSLTLQMKADVKDGIAALEGLDHLLFYLLGDLEKTIPLFDFLHTHQIGVCLHNEHQSFLLDASCLDISGFLPDQALLPLQWNSNVAYTLLKEYFHFPSKFYNVALNNLQKTLKALNGQDFNITILLNKHDAYIDNLLSGVTFSLNALPVINVFPKTVERIEVQNAANHIHVVVDKRNPVDFEVYAIKSLSAKIENSHEELDFYSLFSQRFKQNTEHCYFSMERLPRLKSDRIKKHGARSHYLGSEVFLSLTKENDVASLLKVKYLSAEILATNRDLAILLGQSSMQPRLSCQSTSPLKAIEFARLPNTPFSPIVEGQYAWSMVRLLCNSNTPWHDLSDQEIGENLRAVLLDFAAQWGESATKKIQSIVLVQVKSVTRRLPQAKRLIYVRGVKYTITIDEVGLAGESVLLFGKILAHFLAARASINSFVETHLHSTQRGMIASWNPLLGTRSVV